MPTQLSETPPAALIPEMWAWLAQVGRRGLHGWIGHVAD